MELILSFLNSHSMAMVLEALKSGYTNYICVYTYNVILNINCSW